jgi:hypothetical protein
MGVAVDGLPADDMEVVIDDRRLGDARHRSGLVEQRMALKSGRE